MTAERNANKRKGDQRARSLTKVLKESEHVKDLVEEAASELASVNTVLQEGLAGRRGLPGVEDALEKSEAVEIKVQEASEKLSVVNLALESEVKGRRLLENQLAAVLQQEETARHASFHDPLTGLPNRALFDDRLQHGLAQATRHGWILAVMFMDLDDFKAINDSYGHEVGDRVLKMTAERLKETTRADDTVSRHGGDEFLHLLMGISDDKDAIVIAKKILKAIRVPCTIGEFQLHINASIGIALFPRDGITTEALLKSADTAMYIAKRNGSGYSFAPLGVTAP